MATEGARRLGVAVRAERSRQWPRRADFAAVSGVGLRVIAAIENAERDNFSPDTLAAIEAALSWEPGSAERARAGLRPRRYEDPGLTRLRALWPRLSADARRMLVDLAERAVD